VGYVEGIVALELDCAKDVLYEILSGWMEEAAG
jgi:hypothetical protein